MKRSHEVVVRMFDGEDKNSSLLIGKDAHHILFGRPMATMMKRLGFMTRKVANVNAVSEASLVRDFNDYEAITFPKKTRVKANGTIYEANVALEVRPPLDDVSISKLAPFIAGLLQAQNHGFALFNDRADQHMEEIYFQPYAAKVIALPVKE